MTVVQESDVRCLGSSEMLDGAFMDVARTRERNRQAKLFRLGLFLVPIAGWLWWRVLVGNPVLLGMPSTPVWLADYLTPMALILLLTIVMVVPMVMAGRSPHVLYHPSEITTTFDDVVGLDVVRDEVIRSLNLFLGFKLFRDRMGGTPRRGILFEGPPGTGKTYMAKAMAREAGVPFLFVSSSAFQSMYYGQTNRKVRSYFRALRKAARREGGAIGFIEEIDAIAASRSGMRSPSVASAVGGVSGGVGGLGGVGGFGGRSVERSGVSEGVSGVVNELLIQLQSFDHSGPGQRARGAFVDYANRWLPRDRAFRKRPGKPANVLVIGATNRAADLDPALLRPGRFDRSLHFSLPGRSGRREIIDYYLARKSHVAELEADDKRETLAAMTFGYSPAMIEHLFDEGLVWALRAGRDAMTWDDLQQAKFTEEIGLKQPVEYTVQEKQMIATHEAGHAVVAHLVGRGRKLEVLSIIKRRDALGLLAHSETEERFTQTRSELIAMIHISFGGMVAEELFFGESGTGPSGDLAAATQLAAHMTGSLGMAGSLVSFEAVESGVLSQGIVAKVLANEEGRLAVEKILGEAKAEVSALLEEYRPLVAALRDELVAREELVGAEIVEVMERATAAAAEATGPAGSAGDAGLDLDIIVDLVVEHQGPERRVFERRYRDRRREHRGQGRHESHQG